MKKEKKEYIIFAPINQYGGVNLDVGFLALLISEEYSVIVISLGNFYSNSSVFLFDKNLNYNSLDRIIYNNNFLVKFLTNLICIIKPIKIPKHFRVENLITKSQFINLNKIKLAYIEKEILKADVIVLCSQLTSNYMKEIVDIAHSHNKKIIFRTTGQINKNQLSDENKVWFKKVSVFIHHSKKSQGILKEFMQSGEHKVIDQNACFEEEFLKIPIRKKNISRFFTLSRLHESKGIDTAISAFLKVSGIEDTLTIYGDGADEKRLKKIANNSPTIIFNGKVDFKDVPKIFSENDCLIISSKFEAGPYSGIESMAAGTPLISTRVGAMEERLPNYSYFYDGSEEELERLMKLMKVLSIEDIQVISRNLRKIYLNAYTESTIRELYNVNFE